MSDKGHQEAFLMFVLGLLAVIGLIVAAIYFLAWSLPYVVFYFLPFVAVSVVIGFALRLFTLRDSTTEDKNQFARKFSHRHLGLVYPILVFFTLLIFHVDDRSKVQVDKSGKEKGQYIEWAGANKMFNEWRKSAYADSSFESLRKDAQYGDLYDRRQIGWIVWWALFLGGPAFYFWLSRRDDHEDLSMLRDAVSAQVKWREDRANDKHANLESEIRKATKTYRDEIENVKARHAAVLAENLRLKATVEFSPEVPKPLTDLKKKGVLDSDLL